MLGSLISSVTSNLFNSIGPAFDQTLQDYAAAFNSKYNLFVFERAWWVSTITLLTSQMFDVQYFDGRISIVLWIFLTGLKSSISS